MRKLITLILATLIILFTGIIVVDERQNAVITDYKGTKVVYLAGIHFAWPILDKVTYVYINERTALLTLSINESGQGNIPLQLEVLISYHVINPIDYLSVVNRSDKVGISTEIAKFLVMDIENKLKTESLAKFNQHPIFSVQHNFLTSLGISIDKVDLLSIRFIPDEKKPVKLNASDLQMK